MTGVRLFLLTSRLTLGPIQFLSSAARGFFLEIKVQESEADYSHPLCMRLKMHIALPPLATHVCGVVLGIETT
jgi:hypothetical protein